MSKNIPFLLLSIVILTFFMYMGREVGLGYGVWGQYQKTPQQKFTTTDLRIAAAMAKEWDGECFSEASNDVRNDQRDARYAAYFVGNVAALKCKINSWVDDDPTLFSSAFSGIAMIALIDGELDPQMSASRDELATKISTDDMRYAQSRAAKEYAKLKAHGLLDPNYDPKWPGDPFEAYNNSTPYKARMKDRIKLAKTWTGMCDQDERLKRKTKWRREYSARGLGAAADTGNSGAILCLVDRQLRHMSSKMDIVESLLLVRMLDGSLSPEWRKVLEKFKLQFSADELETSAYIVSERYAELVHYGLAKPRDFIHSMTE